MIPRLLKKDLLHNRAHYGLLNILNFQSGGFWMRHKTGESFTTLSAIRS